MKIIIKEVEKEYSIINTNETYRLNACKPYINGFVEFVRITDTLYMAVSEDGRMMNLPVNFYLEFDSQMNPIQPIVGTVVFVNTKPLTKNPYEEEIEDLEVEEIGEKELELIKIITSDEYRKLCEERYPELKHFSY